MSAPAEPETAPTRIDLEDHITHFWCCDPNTAFCGEDISDAPEVPNGVGHNCVVCLDLEAQTCPRSGPLCDNTTC